MSFVKGSQSISFEGIDIPLKPVSSPFDENELRMPKDHLPFPKELTEDLVIEEEPEKEETVVLEVEEPEKELVLTLDKIPGGLHQDELVEEPETLEVEEPEEVVVNDDPWDWGGVAKNFLPWLSKMMQSIPVHSGKDTAGLERAIAYLEAVDREISRAVRTDLNNEITIDSVEKARDEIQRGLERLEERLDKVKTSKYPKKGKKNKKKASDEQDVLIKEAQKATHVGGIVITVPLFTSYLARVCINGMVSAGHDIEDMFTKLAKRYKLSEREQAELVQLLSDMNYPLRRDRGIPLDEETDTSSSDNFDWAANYRS